MSDEQAKQFLEQATQSLQSGQFQQALELADQAIALKDSDEAQILRGIAWSQLGQPDAATEALRRAISLGPHNPKAYYNLAVHYFSQGRKPEALEMAKEAVRLDTKHAGARDLVARIEAESQPASTVQAPRIDDLTTGGSTSMPGVPGVTGPIEGLGAGPEAPRPGPAPGEPYQAPMATPPGGYQRPGYDTSNEHSLQFVGNMGATWYTIGWIIIFIALAIDVVAIVRVAGMWDQIMQAAQDPAAAQRINQQMWGNNVIATVLQLVSYATTLGGLVWMILELTDRRGNWLWLLPYILVCCCTCGLMQPVVHAIYILAGRPK
jgi:tetratricopeptide (TPR) repeat protein